MVRLQLQIKSKVNYKTGNNKNTEAIILKIHVAIPDKLFIRDLLVCKLQ